MYYWYDQRLIEVTGNMHYDDICPITVVQTVSAFDPPTLLFVWFLGLASGVPVWVLSYLISGLLHRWIGVYNPEGS